MTFSKMTLHTKALSRSAEWHSAASMSEFDFGAIPVLFFGTGHDLIKISLPLNLIPFHLKNSPSFEMKDIIETEK